MEMCAKNKYEFSPNTNTNKLQTQMYVKYKCAPNILPERMLRSPIPSLPPTLIVKPT